MANVGEFKVGLGFDIDTIKLNEFIKDLGEINLRSLISAAGFGAMVEGMKDILDTANQLGSQLNKLTGVTGIKQSVFQQWEEEASKLNVTTGVATDAITTIQNKLANFGTTAHPEDTAWIVKLGNLFHIDNISQKTGPQILQEELRAMQGLDPLQKLRLLNMMGQNHELSMMVGYQDDVYKNAKSLDDSFNKIAETQKAINTLTGRWKTLIIDVGAALGPTATELLKLLDWMTEKFEKLEQKTPQWVKTLLGGLAVLFLMNGVLGLIIGGITKIAEIFGFLKWAVPILASLTPQGRAIGLGVIGAGLAINALSHIPNPLASAPGHNPHGNILINNHYTVNGVDTHSIVHQIKQIHEAQVTQLRDTQSASPGMNH